MNIKTITTITYTLWVEDSLLPKQLNTNKDYLINYAVSFH